MAPKAEKVSRALASFSIASSAGNLLAINPYGIEGKWYKAPIIHCRDGFSVSVQGHPHAYARMRGDGWETVELGFPNRWEELLDEFREYPDGNPTKSVCPQVPVELVDQVLKRHGGIDLNATCRESKQWGMLTRS
jgi:hypothetical protein